MVRLTRHFAAPKPTSVNAVLLDRLSDDTSDLVRLLGEEDCQSLGAHLPHLSDHFRRMCMAVKVLMVQSERDRPDLGRLLIRTQITFTYRMMIVRCHFVWGRFRFSFSRPRP
jgi:hypothetical protein